MTTTNSPATRSIPEGERRTPHASTRTPSLRPPTRLSLAVQPPPPAFSGTERLTGLTDRELGMLELIAGGLAHDTAELPGVRKRHFIRRANAACHPAEAKAAALPGFPFSSVAAALLRGQ